MGDLGVSKSNYSSNQQPSTALARLSDRAPGVVQKTISAIATVDQALDKVPVVGFETPKNPSREERMAAGVAAVLYTMGAGVSIVPGGSWLAAGVIAVGGYAARKMSPNHEVQNQGNLALQTSIYGAGAGFFGFGSVPYARAAVKSALIALNKG